MLGFLALVPLGIFDYLTGLEISFSIFYLIPVSLAAWFAGSQEGILMAIWSSLVWLVADLLADPAYFRQSVLPLDLGIRLANFLIFVYVSHLLAALRVSLHREKKSARIDHATGGPNRRSFFESANIEIERARRYQRPFTVAYLDVDDFKKVNDRFGHPTGDLLLQSVARTIKKSIRNVDLMARLGGDEFALFLPETGLEEAKVVGERIREKISALMQEKKWPATLSIGIIHFSNPPANVEEMIKMVDELMYAAKKQGKNAVHFKSVPELSKH